MKAVVLEALGSPPIYGDFAEPDLLPREALIHVHVASVKQLERLIASGKHYSRPKSLPIVLGLDGVGRLDNGERVLFHGAASAFRCDG